MQGKYVAEASTGVATFVRVSGIQFCGHHVYPTAGTIFHKSTVSLQLWFFAIYLMSSTRCGISAKQLEREIGVTYKTAHRMFKQIRTLLADEDGPLDGDVEVDESAYGGQPRASETHRQVMMRKSYRPTILAMVERGGRVRPLVVPDRGGRTVGRVVREHVLPSSMLFTDEFTIYESIGRDYRGHHRIKHQARIYAIGETHTQTVEGFFGLFKTGVRGVYHAISTDYLQAYLDEYAFRYNRRKSREPMFWAILNRVQKTVAPVSS